MPSYDPLETHCVPIGIELDNELLPQLPVAKVHQLPYDLPGHYITLAIFVVEISPDDFCRV